MERQRALFTTEAMTPEVAEHLAAMNDRGEGQRRSSVMWLPMGARPDGCCPDVAPDDRGLSPDDNESLV